MHTHSFFYIYIDILLEFNRYYIELEVFVIGLRCVLVDPVDRHPLLLVTHLIQGLDHLTEGLIEILVDNYHVEVFAIFALDKAALLNRGNQIVVLLTIMRI